MIDFNPTHCHRKRGTCYEVLGYVTIRCKEPVQDEAKLRLMGVRGDGKLSWIAVPDGLHGDPAFIQYPAFTQAIVGIQTEKPIADGTALLLYVGAKDDYWARAEEEFDDGRFVVLKDEARDILSATLGITQEAAAQAIQVLAEAGHKLVYSTGED